MKWKLLFETILQECIKDLQEHKSKKQFKTDESCKDVYLKLSCTQQKSQETWNPATSAARPHRPMPNALDFQGSELS